MTITGTSARTSLLASAGNKIKGVLDTVCSTVNLLVVNQQTAVLALEKDAIVVLVLGKDKTTEVMSGFLLGADGAILSMMLRLPASNGNDLVLALVIKQQVEERIVRSATSESESKEWEKFSVVKALRTYAIPAINPYQTGDALQFGRRSVLFPMRNNRVLVVGTRSPASSYLHYFGCALISPENGGLVISETSLDQTGVKNWVLSKLQYVLDDT